MTRPIKIIVAALALLFVANGTALAAAAVDPDNSSILDLLRPVYEAFAGGQKAYAAALLVIAMVALLKRYAGSISGKLQTWMHGDLGGSATALVMSSAAAMATGLATPGASVSLSLLKSALMVGVGAAGGFAILKNLVVDPILKPLAAKAPAWAQPIFSIVFYFFDKPDPVATAKKAGDDAVAKDPGQGAASVVGKPDEIK